MHDSIYIGLKRVTDVVLSFVALLCFSPLFLIVLIVDSIGKNKGPVFYKQKRVGKSGEKFYIYKFRSMVVNAEEKLYSNKKLYAQYVANSFKLPDGEDPRITKFGSVLRKSSIDEIPQFINILKGEMSIVGPRPVVERELEYYGDRVDEFLSVKPGAMGYWQAMGRSTIEYPERCDVELYYVQHASLLFDVKIFFKNVISIFKGTGAY
ncbi:undecaprenyl-phosphate galactose phosphotransferase [Paucilactobacillus vaccinostercus DSM 20634]|uniref:Undecaprenyl-phosphate galactose phosphotransferase n=1 Tax=Paucilactobacillus vaccinostercus DSM 20634 TaxID=1423813 RepID=A0A0R2A509_9LACO|nr:sugar transferase [Paucilactobacillus vaccinostercus]KRM61378.1 undecaprenyl-phosphate galactose phosphotransferase [Paucilactobacillus vaccinostercus DSM 20634]